MTPETTTFGLSRIGQIAVTIDDLEEAVRFYRDVLGLKFLFQAPPGLAFFDCGGIRLMLTKPEGESGHHASIIYYKVDDIQGAFDTLSARGAKAEGPPHLIAKLPGHDLWMAFFRDPSNNLLGLMSEVRSKPDN